MPPDAAPVAATAPAAAPAVVLPPADQPPAPAAPKSFGERFSVKVAELGGIDDPEPADAPKPAAAAPQEPKKDAKAPAVDPKEAKRAQLKALAAELGLAVDDAGVSIAERAEFRRGKAAREAAIVAREAEVTKKLAEMEATHGEKFKKAQAVLDAYERGDPESFAAALGAKDFNELQQSWIKRLADPNYMELRRLQQRAEEEDARRETEKREGETRAQQQERQQHYSNYMTELSKTCAASTDPLVQAIADHPGFLHDIYKIQEQNWNDDTQSTVTVEQAIRKAAKGASGTLEDYLKDMHGRLSKGFASVGAVAPAAAAVTNGKATTNGKKPAPKTAVVPSNSGAAGGAPKPVSQMTSKEWAAYKAAKFAESEG